MQNKQQFSILMRPSVKGKIEELYRQYKGEPETKSFSIWIETLICLGIREYELINPLGDE